MSLKVEKCSTEKHEGDVSTLAYRNGFVFSGGADGKVKVWDEDLNLKRTLNMHEAYIFAMAIESKGKLYAASCYGVINFAEDPVGSDEIKELVRCDDPILSMYCDGNFLFTGDDKGVVTQWENDKILFKFNLIEEVKTLAAEKELIYTARDLDINVSAVVAGKSGKYTSKAAFPGRAPLALIGPITDEKRAFLAFTDREGKGLILCKNKTDEKFAQIWIKPDCHEMLINAICGTSTFLYSGGYDGVVKQWSDLDKSAPKLGGEVSTGSCINSICVGGDDNTVYSATSDGFIRRIKFC